MMKPTAFVPSPGAPLLLLDSSLLAADEQPARKTAPAARPASTPRVDLRMDMTILSCVHSSRSGPEFQLRRPGRDVSVFSRLRVGQVAGGAFSNTRFSSAGEDDSVFLPRTVRTS